MKLRAILAGALLAAARSFGGDGAVGHVSQEGADASGVVATDVWSGAACCGELDPAGCDCGLFDGRRRFLQSDHAFDDFIQPVSNPIFARDPRSSTHARFLFINNWTPDTHAVAPDDQIQVYAVQVNLALTERLSLLAEKDGYAVINRGPLSEGLLNLAVGLKYAFLRRPERQFIVSGGLMFEAPTGESAVLQGDGSGVLTPFLSAGKGWGAFHTIANMGLSIPMDDDANSGFFYWQQHFDYVVADWFAPLVEFNWFHYTSGGDRGIPSAVGEGDGLLNFGTTGMAGADLVTVAVGARFRLTHWLSSGLVWETPISSRKDLIDNRIVLDVILRY
jgi:hypothetical protein